MSAAVARAMRARAREAVAEHARGVVADSPMFGRERALAYALGWCEPSPDATDHEVVQQVRGALDGLRDAGIIT